MSTSPQQTQARTLIIRLAGQVAADLRDIAANPGTLAVMCRDGAYCGRDCDQHPVRVLDNPRSTEIVPAQIADAAAWIARADAWMNALDAMIEDGSADQTSPTGMLAAIGGTLDEVRWSQYRSTIGHAYLAPTGRQCGDRGTAWSLRHAILHYSDDEYGHAVALCSAALETYRWSRPPKPPQSV
jgi:hypothetical protein